MSNFIKDGILDTNDFIVPPEVRRQKGRVIMIECVQRIPCNPCSEVCPRKAITIIGDITNIPEVDFDKCNGCGICIANCPGLAIFSVDESFAGEVAKVGIPYESKPLPVAGETVNLIVKFLSNKNDRSLYQTVLTNIESILGEIQQYHPLTENNLQVTSSYKALSKEAIASSRQTSGLKKTLALLKIYFETFITRIVMLFRLPVKAHFYELKNLKKYQVEASDFRKFDGSLKMVLSLNKERRASLEGYLDTEEKNGILVYGTHISDSALLTCLMHSESSSEVHFVDGANGGYAMAAKVLKQKFAKMQA